MRLRGPATAALLLCLAWPDALLPHAARAQETAAPGGDVAERLSRIEQAMWNRETQALTFLREWAVSDPNGRVRERSIGALAVLRDRQAVKIVLDRLSRDPSAPVRRAAAEAVGVLAVAVSVWEITGPLEKDPDPLVRAECARALGLAGLRAAGPALIARLAVDPSPEVRALSAEALARLRIPEAVQLLTQTASNDRSPLAQVYAVRALAEIDPASSAHLFQDVMETARDPDLRAEAFRGLLRSPTAAVWIAPGVADKDDRIRFMALQEWVGRVAPSPERLPRRSDIILKLEELLSDPIPGIRELAKATLEKQGYKVRPSGLVYAIDE